MPVTLEPVQDDEAVIEPKEVATPVAEAPSPAAPIDPPQITIDKTLYQRGEAIAFSVSGLPGNRTDWVTLVPKDASFEEWGSNWLYTQGVTEGEWSFWAPNAPGPYEIRVYFNYPDGGFEVQASTELNVAPAN